ncbi:MAG: hypothetical protein K6G73_01590, partial [Marinilabiliaceae bacterium]|nr:hypothetical protein [Marinilabiliaceae bacterium]
TDDTDFIRIGGGDCHGMTDLTYEKVELNSMEISKCMASTYLAIGNWRINKLVRELFISKLT